MPSSNDTSASASFMHSQQSQDRDRTTARTTTTEHDLFDMNEISLYTFPDLNYVEGRTLKLSHYSTESNSKGDRRGENGRNMFKGGKEIIYDFYGETENDVEHHALYLIWRVEGNIMEIVELDRHRDLGWGSLRIELPAPIFCKECVSIHLDPEVENARDSNERENRNLYICILTCELEFFRISISLDEREILSTGREGILAGFQSEYSKRIVCFRLPNEAIEDDGGGIENMSTLVEAKRRIPFSCYWLSHSFVVLGFNHGRLQAVTIAEKKIQNESSFKACVSEYPPRKNQTDQNYLGLGTVRNLIRGQVSTFLGTRSNDTSSSDGMERNRTSSTHSIVSISAVVFNSSKFSSVSNGNKNYNNKNSTSRNPNMGVDGNEGKDQEEEETVNNYMIFALHSDGRLSVWTHTDDISDEGGEDNDSNSNDYSQVAISNMGKQGDDLQFQNISLKQGKGKLKLDLDFFDLPSTLQAGVSQFQLALSSCIKICDKSTAFHTNNYNDDELHLIFCLSSSRNSYLYYISIARQMDAFTQYGDITRNMLLLEDSLPTEIVDVDFDTTTMTSFVENLDLSVLAMTSEDIYLYPVAESGAKKITLKQNGEEDIERDQYSFPLDIRLEAEGSREENIEDELRYWYEIFFENDLEETIDYLEGKFLQAILRTNRFSTVTIYNTIDRFVGHTGISTVAKDMFLNLNDSSLLNASEKQRLNGSLLISKRRDEIAIDIVKAIREFIDERYQRPIVNSDDDRKIDNDNMLSGVLRTYTIQEIEEDSDLNKEYEVATAILLVEGYLSFVDLLQKEHKLSYELSTFIERGDCGYNESILHRTPLYVRGEKICTGVVGTTIEYPEVKRHDLYPFFDIFVHKLQKEQFKRNEILKIHRDFNRMLEVKENLSYGYYTNFYEKLLQRNNSDILREVWNEMIEEEEGIRNTLKDFHEVLGESIQKKRNWEEIFRDFVTTFLLSLADSSNYVNIENVTKFSRLSAGIVGGTAKYILEKRMNMILYLALFICSIQTKYNTVNVDDTYDEVVNLFYWYKVTYNLVTFAESTPCKIDGQYDDSINTYKKFENNSNSDMEFDDFGLETEDYDYNSPMNKNLVGDITILSSFVAYISRKESHPMCGNSPYNAALFIVQKLIPFRSNREFIERTDAIPTFIHYLRETGQYRALGQYLLQLERDKKFVEILDIKWDLELSGLLGESFVSEGRRLALDTNHNFDKDASDFFYAACIEWCKIWQDKMRNPDYRIKEDDQFYFIELLNKILPSKDLKQCGSKRIAKLLFLLLEMMEELKRSRGSQMVIDDGKRNNGLVDEENEEFFRNLWGDLFCHTLEIGWCKPAYWCLNEERRRYYLLLCLRREGNGNNGSSINLVTNNNLSHMVLSMCEIGRLRDVCSNLPWKGAPKGPNEKIGPIKVFIAEPEDNVSQDEFILLNDYKETEDLLRNYSRHTSMELLDYDDYIEMQKSLIEEQNIKIQQGQRGKIIPTRRFIAGSRTDFDALVTFNKQNPLQNEFNLQDPDGTNLIEPEKKDLEEIRKKILPVHWYQCAYSFLLNHYQYQKAATELYSLHKRMEVHYEYSVSTGRYNIFHLSTHLDILSVAYNTLMCIPSNDHSERYILFPFSGVDIETNSIPDTFEKRNKGRKVLAICVEDVHREFVYYTAVYAYAKYLNNKSRSSRGNKNKIPHMQEYEKLPCLGYIDFVTSAVSGDNTLKENGLNINTDKDDDEESEEEANTNFDENDNESNMDNEIDRQTNKNKRKNGSMKNNSEIYYFDIGIISSEVKKKVNRAIELLILAGLYRTASTLAKSFNIPLNYIVKQLAKTCVILQQGGDSPYVMEDSTNQVRILAQSAVDFVEDDWYLNVQGTSSIDHDYLGPSCGSEKQMVLCRCLDAWDLLKELTRGWHSETIRSKSLESVTKWTDTQHNTNYLYVDALSYIIATESYFKIPSWILDDILKKIENNDLESQKRNNDEKGSDIPLSNILSIFLKKVTLLFDKTESLPVKNSKEQVILEAIKLLDVALDISLKAIKKTSKKLKEVIKNRNLEATWRLPINEMNSVVEHSKYIKTKLSEAEAKTSARTVQAFENRLKEFEESLEDYFEQIEVQQGWIDN